MTTPTPRESRERFEKDVANAQALIGWTETVDDAKAKIMLALDTYTHSLITHAMQQAEAKKFTYPDAEDADEVSKQSRYSWNAAIDEMLTILQSLLPEQKKEV